MTAWQLGGWTGVTGLGLIFAFVAAALQLANINRGQRHAHGS
jgi:hypothetical protein